MRNLVFLAGPCKPYVLFKTCIGVVNMKLCICCMQVDGIHILDYVGAEGSQIHQLVTALSRTGGSLKVTSSSLKTYFRVLQFVSVRA
jgi:hypothetical protein